MTRETNSTEAKGLRVNLKAQLSKFPYISIFSFIVLMSVAALIAAHVRSFEERNFVSGAVTGPEVIAVAAVGIATAVGSLGALQRATTQRSAARVLVLAGLGLLVADIAGIAFGRYW